MIDATLVETPFRPGREDEADKGATPPVDADAALTERQGWRGTHYGYKVHAGVEVETRLIRRLVLMLANINETTIADALVCGDERAVYADKAYAKKARRAWLRSLRIKDRIMHKSWGGGPSLRASQKRHNALIAPIRAQVEGVFATLKRWMGFDRVRSAPPCGEGLGVGVVVGRHTSPSTTTPLPSPPPRKSGLPDLRKSKPRPGQARGAWGGSRPSLTQELWPHAGPTSSSSAASSGRAAIRTAAAPAAVSGAATWRERQ